MQSQKDIILGNQCENISVDIIKKHFSTSNLKKCEEYFVFDFEDDDNFYEIKGRRCNHNYYNSTIISYNKIEYIKDTHKNVYFIFIFYDGHYYYKFNKNDNFEIRYGGRCDRGKKEYKKYLHIPTNILIKL